MVILKYPEDFLEHFGLYELYFYFDREVPASGYYNLTTVYWIIQQSKILGIKHTEDLGQFNRIIY